MRSQVVMDSLGVAIKGDMNTEARGQWAQHVNP